MALLRTPREAADALCALIPPATPPNTLAEYGLEPTVEQAQQITQEVVAVSLFWIWSALDAVLSDKDRDRVFREILRGVAAAWTEELGLPAEWHQNFRTAVEERRRRYAAVMNDGGTTLSVLTETAMMLESGRAVKEEDRRKLVALLLDLVPIEEIGRTVDAIELRGDPPA
jgi:hypothetical protein